MQLAMTYRRASFQDYTRAKQQVREKETHFSLKISEKMQQLVFSISWTKATATLESRCNVFICQSLCLRV